MSRVPSPVFDLMQYKGKVKEAPLTDEEIEELLTKLRQVQSVPVPAATWEIMYHVPIQDTCADFMACPKFAYPTDFGPTKLPTSLTNRFYW